MYIKNFLRIKKLYMAMPAPLQDIAGSYLFNRELKIAMSKFLTKEERNNPDLCKEISEDARQCRKRYKTKASEYFLFGFRGQSDEYRESFLPDHIKDSVLVDLVGWDAFNNELKNKYKFYELAGKWFGRKAMLIDCKGGRNLSDFKKFAAVYPDLFIKSNVLSKGRGAGLYHINNDQKAEEVYSLLKKIGGEWIVEEKVTQSPAMAEWNESSVNTVRVPAILNNDKWTVLGAFFRTGRKGSVVDNAGAGGVFACIDANSGILTTDGIDESGVYYEKHPDSGLKYKGWQIPEWNELIKAAENVQRSMPHHKYVGWDFALTEKGWVLIEANWGQFVSQYNDHIGLKHQFFELLGIVENSK